MTTTATTTATVVLDGAASSPQALDVRTGGRGTWALLLVDVDRVPAPDDVLPRVAAALRDAAGPRGVVSRFGGTVFVVLVPVGGPGTARDAVDATRRAVAALDPAPRGVTASVGAAVLAPPGPESLPALLWAADRALYAAQRPAAHRPRDSGGPRLRPARRPDRAPPRAGAGRAPPAAHVGPPGGPVPSAHPTGGNGARSALDRPLPPVTASNQAVHPDSEFLHGERTGTMTTQEHNGTVLGRRRRTALARYLEQDVQGDLEWARELIHLLDDVREHRLPHQELTGDAWTLTLSPDGAHLVDEHLSPSTPVPLPLDVLRAALEGWCDLLSGPYGWAP